MARQQLGILDGFSGKMDGLVGRKLRSTDVIQKYNDRSNIPFSASQLLQQDRMTTVVGIFESAFTTYREFMWPDNDELLTPLQRFTKYNIGSIDANLTWVVQGLATGFGPVPMCKVFELNTVENDGDMIINVKKGHYLNQYGGDLYIRGWIWDDTDQVWLDQDMFEDLLEPESFLIPPELTAGHQYSVITTIFDQDAFKCSNTSVFQFTFSPE